MDIRFVVCFLLETVTKETPLCLLNVCNDTEYGGVLFCGICITVNLTTHVNSIYGSRLAETSSR